jgi:hypothetical protein
VTLHFLLPSIEPEKEKDNIIDEHERLRQNLVNLEADITAMMEVIEAQGRQLGLIPQLKADKAYLINQLQISEADRAARMEVIEAQGKLQGEIEAERNDARAELNDLRQQLESVELDRAARLDQHAPRRCAGEVLLDTDRAEVGVLAVVGTHGEGRKEDGRKVDKETGVRRKLSEGSGRLAAIGLMGHMGLMGRMDLRILSVLSVP